MQTVGGGRSGEAGGSKLTSFAPSLVYHSCPLAVIPNGGVSGCVRLEGAVGYGNPAVPQSCQSMDCNTLSSQPLRSGKPPRPCSSPTPNECTHFFNNNNCHFILFDAWCLIHFGPIVYALDCLSNASCV